MEALKDAQQGYLRLSEKHSDVLREHLQVLGDLQLLRQESALLHENQVTLLAEHEDLHQEHVALLQVHETLQRQHETLQTDHAGLAKEQHNSLGQDHLRLQDIKESLHDDLDEMTSINHQMAKGIKNLKEEWQRTEEEKKHVQSLLLRAAHEKKWALIEAQEKYDMLVKEKNAVEDELAFRKKEYERAQEEKKRLMKGMAQMAVTEQQIANAPKIKADKWYATKETMMQHVESLHVKVDREKKVTSEALLRYKEIEEERNVMKDELSLLKKAYQEAQEEKVEIRQYHERVVHVAVLTINRLQKRCATISEEHGQRKRTDDEGTKEEWQVAQLMQEAEHKERLSVNDVETEHETQETSENRSQGHEGGFHQPEHLVPGEQEKESRESSEQASEHAQRLANAVNEQI
ncbi:hypothetical protein E2C01_000936 [Portunus trituberculatus]|uniref:Uncharacterized protein n=1 Tax=Portunus trituberculatus TaxID=210409 RepID=A0A5B7CGC6_PORTR|nr:hypothetical protein [Portunus trituberculatus]